MSRLRIAADRAKGLSQRRAQVLALIGTDLSNQEIASLLRIEERTVKAHTAALFAQLGVHSRIQLAQAALLSRLEDCT
ncbi:response regulator transcription factor [Streptomyces sp. CBMA156]|uniref:response regulator transcription factor n=1 Tax=Streptomyces sp. CBMA156 TaxID=1930280 RepID=UPI001661AF25|nr:LuxR C-terminal-related transcriptional regulator [Streptomyces sp. CBMA156]